MAPLRFLDWTIDGAPLSDRLDGTECTLVTNMTEEMPKGNQLTIASLRALLNETDAEFDQWIRFDNERIGILFCPLCGCLYCATVSANVQFSDTTVEWRDVGYEDLSPDEEPRFTLRFDRTQYEATVRAVLSEWSR